jgi:predicted DNA-binding antitoxin AbrB/MazE fold protein
MVKKLEAVYEGGILRPVETLRLAEHQLVNLVILDHLDDDGEDLQFAPRKEFEPLADHQVTLETVRTALSKIPGSLEPDFLLGRNEL